MTSPATAAINPVATTHMPFFIASPGESDTLLAIVIVFVVACVVLAGVFFLTLHTLPERVAHKSKKVQFDIVAILGLIALFTNEHIYWILGLLLAFIDIPDFSHPVRRLVDAVERIAARDAAPPSAPHAASVDWPPEPPAETTSVQVKPKGAAHA